MRVLINITMYCSVISIPKPQLEKGKEARLVVASRFKVRALVWPALIVLGMMAAGVPAGELVETPGVPLPARLMLLVGQQLDLIPSAR